MVTPAWIDGRADLFLCIENNPFDGVTGWTPLGSDSKFSLSPPTSDFILNEEVFSTETPASKKNGRTLLIFLVTNLTMDKVELTGRNLGRIFKFRRGCLHAIQLYYFETKLPNL
jgi:hypothetical protein